MSLEKRAPDNSPWKSYLIFIFFSIQMVYMRSEVHFLSSFSMPKLTYLKELLLTDISGKRKRVQQILSFSFKCFRSFIDNYYHTFRILLLFFFFIFDSRNTKTTSKTVLFKYNFLVTSVLFFTFTVKAFKGI